MPENTNIHITSDKRNEPDLRRLARALIDLAIEQSQAEAEEITAREEDPRAA